MMSGVDSKRFVKLAAENEHLFKGLWDFESNDIFKFDRHVLWQAEDVINVMQVLIEQDKNDLIEWTINCKATKERFQ